VPIADEHLDRERHFLIATISLGVASLLKSHSLKLKLYCWIGIASHDPSPLTMMIANLCSERGGELASSWRNLGSSFVGSQQKAPGDIAGKLLRTLLCPVHAQDAASCPSMCSAPPFGGHRPRDHQMPEPRHNKKP
jgi:hypothetical protein